MQRLGKLSKADFYRIIILCGILISLASLEVLAKAKDADYFNFINASLKEQGSPQLTYEDFVISMISAYVARIIIPAGLALTSWVALVKTGFNQVFIFSWSVFLLAALAFQILSLELTSIFYYLFILLYLLLLIQLIRTSIYAKKEEGK